ncbi:MAG: hypothetical protein HKN23_04095 [Verrucomicrobiales bacterium]|nr:hypothetical protein [Verrucomicrobiales bacterium]
MKTFCKSLFQNRFGKITYFSWEWGLMRLFFAFVVWHAAFPATVKTFFADSDGSKFALTDIREEIDREKANGLAHWFDLEWMGRLPVETGLHFVFVALLIFYLSGKLPLIATGLLLLLYSLIGAIESSPAKDHHATQIVGMVLLGQFLWFAFEAVRKKWFPKIGGPDRPTGAIFFSQQLIAAAYTVSAISKWVNSGGGLIPGANWVSQVPNIAVQFLKNRQQSYFDNLETIPPNSLNEKFTQFVIENPTLAMVAFAPAFFLEFFAILAVWNRRISLLYGTALIAMHLGIAAIMRLPFVYFEAVCLIFLVNVPFWVWWLFEGRKQGAKIDS